MTRTSPNKKTGGGTYARCRFICLSTSILFLTACSDSPGLPSEPGAEIISPEIVTLILPNASYASAVLARAIDDPAVRERMVSILAGLEDAVRDGNALYARIAVTEALYTLNDYEPEATPRPDSPDMSALRIELDMIALKLQPDAQVGWGSEE